MDKRATCRKILRKTALSVLAASILMAGTVDAVRAEETPSADRNAAPICAMI